MASVFSFHSEGVTLKSAPFPDAGDPHTSPIKLFGGGLCHGTASLLMDFFFLRGGTLSR